jgi:hypothetical protein
MGVKETPVRYAPSNFMLLSIFHQCNAKLSVAQVGKGAVRSHFPSIVISNMGARGESFPAPLWGRPGSQGFPTDPRWLPLQED